MFSSWGGCTYVCVGTHWYLEQVELAVAGSNGWKVTGGLCWADNRKPTANRLKLKDVPVERNKNTLAPSFLRRGLCALLLPCCLTYDAAQCELPAAHSLHQPHSQQGKQEVGEGGESGEPDRQPVIPHSWHLQDGGAVVPM